MSTFSNNTTIKYQSGFSGNATVDGGGSRNQLILTTAANEYAILQFYWMNNDAATREFQIGLTSSGISFSSLDIVYRSVLANGAHENVQGIYMPGSSNLYFGSTGNSNSGYIRFSGIILRNTP